MDKNFNQKINKITDMLANGDIEDAVRVSADLFAHTNGEWTTRHNAGEECAELLSDLVSIAILHIQALSTAGMHADAFETATSMLYLIAREGYGDHDEVRYGTIPLGVEAVSEFMNALGTLGREPDDTDREHATRIASFLSSCLYHNYNAYASIHPDVPPTAAARQMFTDPGFRSLIQHPLISTPDGDVSPDDHEPIFADLVGRAKAMGFFND